MKVTAERLADSQVILNIEVDPQQVEASLERAYRRLAGRTAIPGFRRGKVPRPTLERFLGKDALWDEAIQQLVPEMYKEALQEQGIEPIAQPNIELPQRDPLLIRATVVVRPAVELGNYKELRMRPPEVEAKEEEVEAALEQIRHSQSPWVPIERAVQFGDRLTMEVVGRADGRAVINDKNQDYQPLAGWPYPVPGFAEEVVGLERGQEKKFTLSFPPNHSMTQLAGKTFEFRVKVIEVKEKQLLPLDDELAKAIGDFDSLEALRQKVTADLKARAAQEAQRRYEDEMVETVVAGAQMELPTVLIDEEVGRLIAEQREHLGRGQTRVEDYVETLKKTEEELKAELRPLAVQRVQRALVLDRVAELEKIEVSPQEVDQEIERMSSGGGEGAAQIRRLFSSPSGRRSLERLLFTRKTLQRLTEIASGQEEADQVENKYEEGTDE